MCECVGVFGTQVQMLDVVSSGVSGCLVRCNLVLLVYILECSSHLICANYLMKTVTRCRNVVNILSFARVRERVLLICANT